MGIWAAANFLAFPIGPILGGWMLTNFWWGWVFLINVPVALVGLLAVVGLVPESRATERPRVDVIGVLASSAGLTLLTYGLIEAGQNGWSAASAVAPILAGLIVLVAFFVWEGRLTRRPDRQPLVDLGLFRSPAFTWGVILAGTGLVALVGILFTMPQYFQAIRGTDAQGSGLRLLPVIAGLVIGAVPADRLAARVGPKLTVALGFAVTAVAMLVGATTTVGSSDGFTVAWMFFSGAGIGLALATAGSAAVVNLPADKSAVGAALMQTAQRLGAPFGSAVLGSVLNTTYRSQLEVTGLPAEVVTTVKESVFAGLAVARQAGLRPLANSVRASFVSGLDDALRVSVAISVAGVVLALVFLPARMPAEAQRKRSRQHDRQNGIIA